jgi:hypothetical protein
MAEKTNLNDHILPQTPSHQRPNDHPTAIGAMPTAILARTVTGVVLVF